MPASERLWQARLLLVCFSAASNCTYLGELCLLDYPATARRILQPSPVDPQAATLAVTRRFLSGYGPVTHHELARWWGGGGVISARQWIGALNEGVSAVDVNGEQAWMLAADAREARLGKMNAWRSEPQRGQVMQFGPRRSTMKLIIRKRRGRIATVR